MKYSEKRFRRVLAAVRCVMGFVYICYGYEKLFDTAYFDNGFLQRLTFWENAVAPWYEWMWRLLWEHTHRWTAFFGTVEMFIGVALLLGLAIRPACLVGMIYTAHLFALSWFPYDQTFLFWRFLELHLQQIALFSLFLLMGVGHAGDIWGLGAFYHRTRLRWRTVQPREVQYSYFGSQVEEEGGESAPASIPAPEDIRDDKAS